jgi:hypothetical protein
VVRAATTADSVTYVPLGPIQVANGAAVVLGFARDLDMRGGRSLTRTCWPAHEARRAPSAASCLAGEEFIVVLVIVMACGPALPGGAA